MTFMLHNEVTFVQEPIFKMFTNQSNELKGVTFKYTDVNSASYKGLFYSEVINGLKFVYSLCLKA